MDEPQSTSKTELTCFCCGASTPTLHLGIGCRACAIFYRRVKKSGKRYYCKTGTSRCDIERDETSACKKCRWSKLSTLVDSLMLPNSSTSSSSSSSSSSSASVASSVSLARSESVDSTASTPVLDRLRRNYETLCMVRQSGELNADGRRKTFRQIAAGENKLDKATYPTCINSSKILVESLFDFVGHSFDEFDSFTELEKWQVVRNFYESFVVIEHTHRSEQNFGSDMTRFVTGYTLYLDYNDAEGYFRGRTRGDLKGAKELYKTNLDDAAKCRLAMRECPLDDVELVAALGLEMWNCNEGIAPLSDEIMRAFELNRSALLRDLHTYYREVALYPDYAIRLGRIFCLILQLKSHLPKFRENFTMWRLMNVVTEDEDNLAQQLYKLEM